VLGDEVNQKILEVFELRAMVGSNGSNVVSREPIAERTFADSVLSCNLGHGCAGTHCGDSLGP
jgi:hypothetical protein